MPAIYTGMPFTVEGRMSDQDNFPNNFLSYTWSVLSQPANSNLLFLNTNSVTPSLLVDTAGTYSIQLTAFDGLAFASATYTFTAAGAWGASAYLAGSCASSGSGLSTTIQVVYANATSINSQTDANTKAAAYAANALAAVNACCPASLRLAIPADAPSGSNYEVTVIPADANPQEDFGADAGYSLSFSFLVGGASGSPAGSVVELYNILNPNIFTLNEPINLTVIVQELSPVTGTLFDVTDFVANINAQPGGSLPGVTSRKIQKQAPSFAPVSGNPNPDRSLGWELTIPQPTLTKANITITNRVPPLNPWQVDANGWDWVIGSSGNALGLFILTGGTLAVPTSEALVMGMNTGNSEPSLLDAYYNFFGYSQIPYQGSIYGYNDRRAFASVPHTGFVNTTPSVVQSWVAALINYINANHLAAPWNVYFRAGIWSGSTYTWTANTVPLYLERNAGAVSIGSLTAGSGILAAASSVLIIAATALTTQQSFFATVQGAPVIMLDNYRFNTGFPSGVQVGVYNVVGWPTPTAASLLSAITPGAVAGRGYDVNNLATNATLKTALASPPVTLAFYLLDGSGNPIANSFPITLNNLTSYAPSSPMYAIGNMPSGVTGVPASTGNVLTINNAGTKLYVANLNS